MGLVRGDVEIHRRQRDWDSHGHGNDPNYNGVVIHGALETTEPETALHSGASAPVVSLEGLLNDPDATGAPESEDSSAGNELWEILARRGYHRPASPDEAGALLDRAGDERFRRRAALLGRFAAEQGPEQALYEAIMEGLGYRHNQQPFVRLAYAAPVDALRRAALPVLHQQRPMVLRHWLLAVSGLSEGKSSVLPPGVGPAMERKEWHLFRVRPANHPSIRIGGAAELLARFLEPGLLTGLAGSCGSLKKLTAALTIGGQDRGTAPIGAERARDLAVNAALPLLHGQSGEDHSPYLELFRGHPKLQGNEVVREMADQLILEDWRGAVKNGRRQQGLLHLAALLRGAS